MTAEIAICIGIGLLIASLPSGSVLGMIGAVTLIIAGTKEEVKK